jgi:hypothetical protein
MLIDADGEEFSREALSFASIPDTLDRFCNLFARCRHAGLAPHGAGAGGPERDRRLRHPLVLRPHFPQAGGRGHPAGGAAGADALRERAASRRTGRSSAARSGSSTRCRSRSGARTSQRPTRSTSIPAVTPEEVAPPGSAATSTTPARSSSSRPTPRSAPSPRRSRPRPRRSGSRSRTAGNDAPDDEGGKKPGEE